MRFDLASLSGVYCTNKHIEYELKRPNVPSPDQACALLRDGLVADDHARQGLVVERREHVLAVDLREIKFSPTLL